jgi:hypothetical protein
MIQSPDTSTLPQNQKTIAKLSRSTFEELPSKFKKVALNLEQRGEILIVG